MSTYASSALLRNVGALLCRTLVMGLLGVAQHPRWIWNWPAPRRVPGAASCGPDLLFSSPRYFRFITRNILQLQRPGRRYTGERPRSRHRGDGLRRRGGGDRAGRYARLRSRLGPEAAPATASWGGGGRRRSSSSRRHGRRPAPAASAAAPRAAPVRPGRSAGARARARGGARGASGRKRPAPPARQPPGAL